MKIVIDAFGGDNAPRAVIEGITLALAKWDDMEFIITGRETELKKELELSGIADSGKITIVNADSVITCDEQPTAAVKQKRDSSLVKALNIIAEGNADCFISAGSTGAVLTGATLIVRRIPGVKRPALAPVIPTAGSPFILIDCGANADCKPEYLQQFAVMGSAYMQGVMGVEHPRVGLVNIGSEEAKGNELVKAAHALLKETNVNFKGNCEGRDIFSGEFDVVVTDGFTGNIILKEAEGFSQTLFKIMKRELTSSFIRKIGAALAKPGFRSVKRIMDYKEYGGAPLLGINGGIIKAHGSSDAKAFLSAIRQARKYVLGNVTEKIASGVAQISSEY